MRCGESREENKTRNKGNGKCLFEFNGGALNRIFKI